MGRGGAVKKTYVNDEYVESKPGPPMTYLQALTQQHPNVGVSMNDLCRKLARFKFAGRRKAEILQEISVRLDKAIQRQIEQTP
jgi:hypothetical protein